MEPPSEADDVAARALDVRFIEGYWRLIGNTVPIRADGEPVHAFDPAWQPVHVVRVFVPVYLLALRHDDSNAASLDLDAEMNWIGGRVRSLPPELFHPLRAQVVALFRVLMDRIVAAPRPDWSRRPPGSRCSAKKRSGNCSIPCWKSCCLSCNWWICASQMRINSDERFAIGVTTRYARAAVGQRIRALRDPRLAEDRTMACRPDGEGRTCVLLGLRVGNRTVPDPVGFLIGVVGHLVRRLGLVTVVLDGSNAHLELDATAFYGAASLRPGRRSPPARPARRWPPASSGSCRAGCSSRRGGAGPAKYRWACNKPGFVVTNRRNLSHPGGELLIYQSPEIMEALTAMHLIAADHVADAPGEPGFYANFQPDAAAVAAGIDRLIAETAVTA